MESVLSKAIHFEIMHWDVAMHDTVPQPMRKFARPMAKGVLEVWL